MNYKRQKDVANLLDGMSLIPRAINTEYLKKKYPMHKMNKEQK